MKHVLLKKVDREHSDKIKTFLYDCRPGDEVTLSIQAAEGGYLAPALDILQHFGKASEYDVKIRTVVYTAHSMAAIIALLAGPVENRVMMKTGSLKFHLGNLELEAGSDFDVTTGVIAPAIMIQFRTYKLLLDNLLEHYGLTKDANAMSQLYGTNWLQVSAEKCLELGMVSRLI